MKIGSFAGGFFARGRQDIEDIRESNREMVNFTVQTWVQNGLSESKSRKEKRRETDSLVKKLKSEFTPDQVGVILKQGDGDKMVNHLDTLKGQGSPVNAKEIVTFADGYEESGLTYSDIVDRYMGKVNSGVDSSTALAEATGSSRFMKKRIQAFENAFGVPMSQLRALAQQDITYDDMPTTGNINMTNPVAVAQARDVISGRGTTQGIKNDLVDFSIKLHGGSSTRVYDPATGTMEYRTEGIKRSDELIATQFAAQAGIEYDNFKRIQQMTPDQAYLETLNWMRKNAPDLPSTPKITQQPTGGSTQQPTGGSTQSTMTQAQILAPLTSSSFRQLRNKKDKQQQVDMVRNNLVTMLNITVAEADKLVEPYRK
jgi:hypothetical protein